MWVSPSLSPVVFDIENVISTSVSGRTPKTRKASYQGVANIRIFEYIRIFSGTNIRSYHIRIIFLMRIYSDIHSYCFFDTNIFGYSFVSFFWYEYIRIFVRIVFWFKYIQEKNLTFAPTGPKDKWVKLFTQRLMFKENLLSFCCVNYVSTFCCITNLKSSI